jgi:hypothetical protein
MCANAGADSRAATAIRSALAVAGVRLTELQAHGGHLAATAWRRRIATVRVTRGAHEALGPLLVGEDQVGLLLTARPKAGDPELQGLTRPSDQAGAASTGPE